MKVGVRRVQLALSRPVDGAWLAAFRILFGVAMAASMLRFLGYGWVERFFVLPAMHFKYWGFSWIEPLSPGGMTALFWCLALCALGVSLGLFYRMSAWFFAIGLTYVQLIDVSTYLNHYYLAALFSFLLAVSPAHHMWSLDRFLFRRLFRQASTLDSEQIASVWLYLLRFQVAVVYVFAGLAKLNTDWLIHAQPLRIWLGARTDVPLIGPLFAVEGVPLAMSWAGFLFDTTIVVWLSLRKTRPYAYVAVLLFHALTRLLFPIGMFPVIMSLGALVFFAPSWPRRWIEPWTSATFKSSNDRPLCLSRGTEAKAHAAMPLPNVAYLIMAAYCLVQLALPLRYLAYDGNVMWHEQGMRFSWRVMLRAKGGQLRLVVSDRKSGARVYVDPSRYLTDLQEAEMVSQPDLILQMAHHVAGEYKRRGFADVIVQAESRISLNGRRSAIFVDPAVDLTKVHDDFRARDWLTPAPTQPPHHTRPVL